jgi:ribonuclease P/MRP protein subunit RPP1
VDIISLDFSDRLKFYLTKPLVKQAIDRGIVFEVCYGRALEDQTARKYILSNAMTLAKVSKVGKSKLITQGKNIIFSSEVSDVIYHRSPFDVINL